jgi:nicotinate-nucleotide pyrophosphorylase (carboxylating)
MLPKHTLREIIRTALEEDIGRQDITTATVLTGQETGNAVALAKSELMLAGLDVFRETFLFLDPSLSFSSRMRDGLQAVTGDTLAEITGRLSSILTAERVALNLFQRMCGIATLTSRYVAAVSGTGAKILDTRKTAPGLRMLDKYAVKVGGGFNHRFGLDDGILIKDNHIAAAGGIDQAVKRVRGQVPHTLKMEVEAGSLDELAEALRAGADVIMLDNMSLEDMKAAVAAVNGRVPLEASGNVTLARARQIAETGVDYISVGALTHSVTAADISLKINP